MSSTVKTLNTVFLNFYDIKYKQTGKLTVHIHKWERLGAHLTSDQLLLPQSTFGRSRPARSVSRSIMKKKNNNNRFFFWCICSSKRFATQCVEYSKESSTKTDTTKHQV
jgi:hypothetical protein